MTFLQTFLLAQRTIQRNKLRSALTMLGIVIGVAAVVCMVTLGSGATRQVTEDIGKLGSNVLHVRPGQEMRGPGGARSSSDAFTLKDAEAISGGVAGIDAVAPMAESQGQAIYGGNNWSTTLTGTNNEYFSVQGWALAGGRTFTSAEIRAGKSVCLLGATVREQLFGDEDPLGKSLRIGKISFQVIGLLEEKGEAGFGRDQDDVVIVPLKTLQRRVVGNSEVSTIMVSVTQGMDTQTVKTEIEGLLRERRAKREGGDDDFHVRDMTEIIDTMTGATTVLTGLLSSVAGVSLLVGGIGIMNIMLVSVTERTREIGTRLAIGARERDVLMQFLVEAVVLSSFGGIIGIILGFSSAALLANLVGVPFVFRPGIAVLSFLFSGAVGVLFGYMPARKAAAMNPIEALRYE